MTVRTPTSGIVYQAQAPVPQEAIVPYNDPSVAPVFRSAIKDELGRGLVRGGSKLIPGIVAVAVIWWGVRRVQRAWGEWRAARQARAARKSNARAREDGSGASVVDVELSEERPSGRHAHELGMAGTWAHVEVQEVERVPVKRRKRARKS